MKTLIIAKSKDLNTESAVEKTELVDIIVSHDVTDSKMLDVRNHKKRTNPTKYSIPHDECDIQVVKAIAYDIDGLVVYRLPFDPRCRHKNG